MVRHRWQVPALVLLELVAVACSEAADVTSTDRATSLVSSTPASTPVDTSVPAPTTLPDPVPGRVMVLHETAGFRHESISAAIDAITEIARALGMEIIATDDSSALVSPGLAGFDAIVFLSTTGDILDPAEQAAMESFVQSGHGYVGIHSASDTEYEWPWYGGLVGAYFADHPAIQPAVVRSTGSGHPAGASLPAQTERVDEWYNFREVPGPGTVVLATIDESTYDGGTMGANHPIAWAHEYEGGRAFYTGFGHTIESYTEEVVVDHLTAGLAWAAGIDEEQSPA